MDSQSSNSLSRRDGGPGHTIPANDTSERRQRRSDCDRKRRTESSLPKPQRRYGVADEGPQVASGRPSHDRSGVPSLPRCICEHLQRIHSKQERMWTSSFLPRRVTSFRESWKISSSGDGWSLGDAATPGCASTPLQRRHWRLRNYDVRL